MNLSKSLDDEFKRVAKQEDISMEQLVDEVAALIHKTPRQVYNYRSGKLDLPSQLIPILCDRFKSHALMQALRDEVNRTPLEIPEKIDFAQLATSILRDICDHHFAMIAAFKGDAVLDRASLTEIEAKTDDIIQKERMLHSLIEAEYKSRVEKKRKQA